MNAHHRLTASVLGAAAVLAAVTLASRYAATQPKAPAPPPSPGAGPPATAPALPNNPKPSSALPAAEHLRIHVGTSAQAVASLLDPASPAWTIATPTSILLSKAPRIYPNEPKLDVAPPRCEVRALRSAGHLVVSLRWTDATQDVPTAPAAKTGEGGGEPSRLYQRPTDHPASFPDAAAVMVPNAWNGPSFPSLMMGDVNASATLYYWSGSRGGAILNASGRTTVRPVATTLAHRAAYDAGQWTVTMSLPDQPDGYPVALAIWDGSQGDRDGLKFFSIWYVLTANTGAKG